ncbi:MAG: HAD domain-containing protein [Solirubrobacteraceae bacterium]
MRAKEQQPDEKPLLMVDIDGVISLFGFAGQTPWTERVTAQAGSFHTIDGVPHFLSPAAAAHLLTLATDFDLVWASGWEEKAEEYLPRLLDLPAGLPFLSFERSPGRGNAHWKLATIEEYAGSRALAWIDDAFNDSCHAWAATRPAPTLLVQTAPERGLTSVEAQLLLDWARELSPARNRRSRLVRA